MADVFCLPSAGPGETWGLAINEAIASGTPCLVSNRAGCATDLAPSDWVVALDPMRPEEWTAILDQQLQKAEQSGLWRANFLIEYAHQTFVDQIKTALTQ